MNEQGIKNLAHAWVNGPRLNALHQIIQLTPSDALRLGAELEDRYGHNHTENLAKAIEESQTHPVALEP